MSETFGERTRRYVLEHALRAARTGGYDWVTTPFFLALTLRTPLA